jgi:hypothetical protein
VIIDRVLASLPPGLELKAVRRALREAYPFGIREHWPYRMWCAEVKQALAPYRAKEAPDRVTVTAEGVHCTWCGNRTCLACAAAQDEWDAGAGDLLRKCEPDAPPGIVADLLEDHGYDGCAKLLRASP